MTKAVEELGMKADELPKFKPPPQHSAATANAMAINSSEFNPYKGYRYDAKAAAVGQNLGPEEDYVSPTELQLQALQSAKKSLENSLHQPIFEREITALLPNATLQLTQLWLQHPMDPSWHNSYRNENKIDGNVMNKASLQRLCEIWRN